MTEALATFQSQLSGVMETVFKAAIYEITRLVENSFVEEVIQCREQVETLKRRLKVAESRRSESRADRRDRCADCGRVGASGGHEQSEKSLKQEFATREEVNSAAKTTSEDTEERQPQTHDATRVTQTSGVIREEFDGQLKEEALQVTSELNRSEEWCSSTEEPNASSHSRPNKYFSQHNIQKCHTNWETDFEHTPESSHNGQSGDTCEANFDGNQIGGFDRTGYEDGSVIDMDNYDGLQGSSSHLAHDRYVDQYDANKKAPEGAEHQSYPSGSPHSGRPEQSLMVESNSDVHGELSCLLIDEKGYLQDQNVQYADRMCDNSSSRMSLQDQCMENSGDTGEHSDIYGNPLALGQKLQHLTGGGEGRNNVQNQTFTSLPDPVSFKPLKGVQKDTRQGSALFRNQCGKTLSQACNLKSHHKISAQTLHLCNHCGRGFHSFLDLKTHKCGQAGDKPYCCAVCGNKFSRLWNLKLHQRIHTQEKPHRCTMCEKSFTRADILKVHQRTHTGERPYRCAVCGLSFKRLDHLKSHQRKHVMNLTH